MINVLQKVTTFPIELIDFKRICDISSVDVHNYYSTLLKDQSSIPNDKKPLTETEINTIKGNPGTYNGTSGLPLKKRFIGYTAIYDKIFSNNLNLLEKMNKDETTVVVFPVHDQSGWGKIDLNPIADKYYSDKFDRIKKDVLFYNQSLPQSQAPAPIQSQKQPFCYVPLIVFRSEKKEEYKNAIKNQFEDIKRTITEYNKTIQSQISGSSQRKPVQNVLFIIDPDKKGLFTGFYNKPLDNTKQEILNKEYENFLNSSSFRRGRVDENGLNITYSDVVKQAKSFKQMTLTGIGEGVINTKDFNDYLADLKEKYKKVTDKAYKKSLELKDNVEELKIYYKIENADKVLEPKIETGSNKLYTIYEDPDSNKNIIGFFTLSSEARKIYRFKEDMSYFKRRTRKQAQSNEKELTNEEDEDESQETERSSEALDFALEIKDDYGIGIFKYKNLNFKETKNKNVKEGEVKFFMDKLVGKFKWFNLKDIDSSFLDKSVIKYYPNILFDKTTLIAYLTSKQKYNDKTVLAYEFLKINDGPELSEYCDFINTNFKSTNIIDEKAILKINFTVNTIIQNIIDIVFETNTPIYLRASKKQGDDKREASNDSYKIVKYEIHDIESDESCGKDCQKEYKDYTNKKRALKVVVTKSNIKDAGELKSATDCKMKKNKLAYDYKQLFANITRRIGFGYLGGSKKRNRLNKWNRSNRLRQRRLKTKRYK